MRIAEEQGLRNQVTALVLDWAQGREPPFAGRSKEEFADVIVAAHVVADESRLGLHRWIDAARRAGMSWSEVGDTLGITKQAAQQRFRSVAEADEGERAGAGADLEVRYGATAFTEMRMLEEEGRRGNELVGTGGLRLTFRRTDRAWEYQRTIGLTAPVESMERQGWAHVSSWFPFHYFKRPVAG